MTQGSSLVNHSCQVSQSDKFRMWLSDEHERVPDPEMDRSFHFRLNQCSIASMLNTPFTYSRCGGIFMCLITSCEKL